MLWSLVVAGLEIHVAAEDASNQFSRSTMALMCDRRVLTRVVGSWREGVISRGPARAAAVARAANDARASYSAMLGDLRWGNSVVRAAGGLDEMVIRLSEPFGALSERVRMSSVSRRVATGWYLRMWFARWDAAVLLWGSPRGRWQRCGTEGLMELASVVAGVGAATAEWEGGPGGLSGARAVVWRPTADGFGLARVNALSAWRRARKQWAMSGGWAAMAAERPRAAALMDLVRDVARAQQARGVFLAGTFVPMIVMQVRRSVQNAAIAEGLEADGRGRWAVDEVLDWRGKTCRGPDGKVTDSREALVRWLGFERRSGEPWKDQWVPRRSLTEDLRGTRKRVAGVAAPPAPKCARHSSTRGSTLRGGSSKLVRGIGDSAGFVVAERKRARRVSSPG